MRKLAKSRVVVVDDHALFAEAMEIALGMEGHDVRRIPLVRARTSMSLMPMIVRHDPQVVLLDLDLGPCGDGIRLIEPLSQLGIDVVVVTGDQNRSRWGESVRYGARCVLAKDSPYNDILATIRRLGEGLPVLGREEREHLLGEWRDNERKARQIRRRLESLTPRETQVLGHLMAGHQVREIARIEFLSEATIRTQVKSILAKLETTSQLGAVGAAHHVGWHPPVQIDSA